MATSIRLATPAEMLYFVGSSSLNTMTLNSAGVAEDALAAIFRLPIDGEISHIGTSLASKVGSLSVVNMQIETTSAGPVPAASAYNGCSAVAVTNPSTGWTWTEITPTKPVGVAGDIVAVTVRMTTADTSLTYNTAVSQGGTGRFDANLPFAMTETNAAAWAALGSGAAFPCCAIKYTSGLIVWGSLGVTAASQATFNSGSSPNEKAMAWLAEAAQTIFGAAVYGSAAATTATFDVKAYPDSGTTPGATISVTAANVQKAGAATAGLSLFRFKEPVAVLSGASPAVSLTATNGDNIRTADLTFGDSDLRQVACGRLTGKTRAGGAWTDTPTQAFGIIPILDEITIPVAGGGSGVATFYMRRVPW